MQFRITLWRIRQSKVPTPPRRAEGLVISSTTSASRGSSLCLVLSGVSPSRKYPNSTAVWHHTSTAAAVKPGTTMDARNNGFERPQKQLQYDRSRSISPRIVRGPEAMMFQPPGSITSPSASKHHRTSSASASAAEAARERQLYDLPSPKSHHRSRSLHGPCNIQHWAYDEIQAGGAGRDTNSSSSGCAGSNDSHATIFHNFHQQQQQLEEEGRYIFRTSAADSAVAATVVPVPRVAPTASNPYRTPTAAGAVASRFWDEPGESPSKQQRNSTTPVFSKDHRNRQHHHQREQQQQQQCLFRGCVRRHGGIQGNRYSSRYCPEHRTPGMSDATTSTAAAAAATKTTSGGKGSRRNRCLMLGCSKPPRYALPGQKAEYCTLHKMDNYVDVKHPRCESELGCVRQPTFGWEGEKARFCSAHKVDGMLDVKNPRCGEPGCLKRPRYGEEGRRARFCAAHRFDDMVDLASRRSAGGGSSSGKHCLSPAKRQRDGPRSIAHDSNAAAAAAAAAAAPSPPGSSMMPFSLRAAVGGAGVLAGAPVSKRGHTPARAGGHRRATSESWIDFCPKRVFETTGAKDAADGAGVDVVPVPRRSNAPRRNRHHAPRIANANMASTAAAAGSTTNPNGLSMMGEGDNFSFNEEDEREMDNRNHYRHRSSSSSSSKGIAGTVFFQGGSSGRAGCFGRSLSGTSAATSSDSISSVSIAALGGEIANLAAAPISDASPLPSPGSPSSPLSGAATACTSKSTPAPVLPPALTSTRTSSGFCFSTSFSSGSGEMTTATPSKKQAVAPVATVTMPVTPQSSSDSIGGGSGGSCEGGRGHRFNACDYEASAILLECRSGMLSAEQRI
ncbi:unnamed protein product [Pylaiella littoralis]